MDFEVKNNYLNNKLLQMKEMFENDFESLIKIITKKLYNYS